MSSNTPGFNDDDNLPPGEYVPGADSPTVASGAGEPPTVSDAADDASVNNTVEIDLTASRSARGFDRAAAPVGGRPYEGAPALVGGGSVDELLGDAPEEVASGGRSRKAVLVVGGAVLAGVAGVAVAGGLADLIDNLSDGSHGDAARPGGSDSSAEVVLPEVPLSPTGRAIQSGGPVVITPSPSSSSNAPTHAAPQTKVPQKPAPVAGVRRGDPSILELGKTKHSKVELAVGQHFVNVVVGQDPTGKDIVEKQKQQFVLRYDNEVGLYVADKNYTFHRVDRDNGDVRSSPTGQETWKDGSGDTWADVYKEGGDPTDRTPVAVTYTNDITGVRSLRGIADLGTVTGVSMTKSDGGNFLFTTRGLTADTIAPVSYNGGISAHDAIDLGNTGALSLQL